MKIKKGVLMWLVVAVVALVAIFMVDFDRLSQRERTDEEFDALENDIVKGETVLEGEDALEATIRFE